MKIGIITGASQGIGYALAKLLSEKGYTVYGISRSGFELAGVTSIKADVTDFETLSAVYQSIYEKHGKIDFLVNNAGMGISGSVEDTKLEDVEKIFKVNFNGVFNSTKAALPFLRKSKPSKILNISSVAAEFPIPFQAFYSSTKAAVTAFSDALLNEVEPFGISVCTILPGDIKTNFTKNREKNRIDSLEYKNRVEKSLAVMERDEQNGMTVEYAARVIYKVIKKNRTPLHKTIGVKYKVMIFLKRILPRKLVNKLIGSIYGFKKL